MYGGDQGNGEDRRAEACEKGRDLGEGMFPSPPVIEGLGTTVGSPMGPGRSPGDLPIYNVYIIKPLLLSILLVLNLARVKFTGRHGKCIVTI